MEAQSMIEIVILIEMLVMVILVFKTPLRKVVIMGVDKLKRGRVKAVGSTIFLYSLMQIPNRDGVQLTPTHQPSLIGFSLFLALIIHRLHHYIRQLRIRRKNMEAIKKQNRIIENANNASQDHLKALENQITALKEKNTHLESELEDKTKEATEAEANANALKKQSEGFLLEYDRLLEDNQNLRLQLQSSARRRANHL